MPQLIVGGKPHRLVAELITIGRAPNNLIQIDDSSVSAHHAELRADENGYRLRDLGSSNGTRLNGSALTEAHLRHGDCVRFGEVEARFEAAAKSEPGPPIVTATAKAAETSSQPADFVNASPFRARSKERDPAKRALLIAAVVGLVALLGGLLAVITMRPPTL